MLVGLFRKNCNIFTPRVPAVVAAFHWLKTLGTKLQYFESRCEVFALGEKPSAQNCNVQSRYDGVALGKKTRNGIAISMAAVPTSQ